MPLDVPAAVMQHVYEAVRTPHKLGPVLNPPKGTYYDCPSVFRFRDKWYMVFAVTQNLKGYETAIAESDDLVNWREIGKPLPFATDDAAWDRWQADGGIALADTEWGGPCGIQQYDGQYWMTYLGGALQGYETDPLAIGIAHADDPTTAQPWTRLPTNPVLAPSQPDVRAFERKTLYKSFVLWDKQKTLGHEFVMFYNGKQEGPGTERIGMAVSDDMRTWKRCGDSPVIDNGPKGISGDPQLVRMDDGAGGKVWVMFYFGHVWKPKAFDTFACSYDLVTWTKWDGPHLIEPSPAPAFDDVFAHKPWVIKWDGIVYHFYCAVSKENVRTIALATSAPLKN
jgi:sucrose-6-phosphate hydrolase SacC (GH32 family)